MQLYATQKVIKYSRKGASTDENQAKLAENSWHRSLLCIHLLLRRIKAKFAQIFSAMYDVALLKKPSQTACDVQ